MKSVFVTRRIPYSLRDARGLKTSNVRSTKYGSETVSFRAPEVWLRLLKYLNQKLRSGYQVGVHVDCATPA